MCDRRTKSVSGKNFKTSSNIWDEKLHNILSCLIILLLNVLSISLICGDYIPEKRGDYKLLLNTFNSFFNLKSKTKGHSNFPVLACSS